jgi:signal transduction histidine kinase
MNISKNKVERVHELINSIGGTTTDVVYNDFDDFLDVTISKLEEISLAKALEKKQKEDFVNHLQDCIFNNFFEKIPIQEVDEDIALMSYVFNTYLEELESQVVMRDNFELIFNSIEYHVIVIDHDNAIRFINLSARSFYNNGDGNEFELFDQIGDKELIDRVIKFKSSSNSHLEFEYNCKIESIEKSFYYRFLKITFEGKNQLLIIGEDQTIKKNAQLEILRATLLGQDKERNRLSKDLHDSLGQKLNAIKMHVNASIGLKTESEKYKYLTKEILDITSQSISMIQEICFDLIPANFETSTLITVINELISRSNIGKTDFIFSYNHSEITFQNKKDELFIYRIVQEFVNNSLKYANADTIYIIIKHVKKSGEFEMNLVDDGVGFDMSKTVYNNGIYNMQQRLNTLKASYKYKSTPNKGTQLKFKLNLKK